MGCIDGEATEGSRKRPTTAFSSGLAVKVGFTQVGGRLIAAQHGNSQESHGRVRVRIKSKTDDLSCVIDVIGEKELKR